MDLTTSLNLSSSRPYRSHKVPACDLCRRRKIHCNVDIAGQPCRFCRERQLTCDFTPKSTHVAGKAPAKRRKVAHGIASPSQTDGLAHFPSIAGTSPNESSLMLNPPMAEDIEVLEHYLTSHGAASASSAKPYSVVSNTPGKPIVYLTVPRRRQGLQADPQPGLKQREVMEQVLGQHKAHLVDLYFSKLHPCFPMIDEVTFHELWQKDPARISSVLMCDLYAAALHFWNTSDHLKLYPRPDLVFSWNQAVSALQEDFLGSTISTVHASLLDLVGRPVLSITGNIVTLGKTVALAHSLGLHRDPTKWRVTEHEKNIRVRLWWGVLVHDHWSSLAHGTPPLIHAQNYDVPLPETSSNRGTSTHDNRPRATFIQLCSLSRILGRLLPLVYSLHSDQVNVTRTLRQIECSLDEWEAKSPSSLLPSQSPDADMVNGTSNLHFCLLSIKLLLCRIAFKVTVSGPGSAVAEEKPFRLSLLRAAAFTLIDFVIHLTSEQFDEFWLPYTAHLLVTAATITLRCLLESTDLATKRTCARKLVDFWDRLATASAEYSWDLADFCLDRCSEHINKIANAMGVTTSGTRSPSTTAERDDAQTEPAWSHVHLDDITSDLFFPVDTLDYPFDALWSMPL